MGGEGVGGGYKGRGRGSSVLIGWIGIGKDDSKSYD